MSAFYSFERLIMAERSPTATMGDRPPPPAQRTPAIASMSGPDKAVNGRFAAASLGHSPTRLGHELPVAFRQSGRSTFDMRGSTRLAEASPLGGRVRHRSAPVHYISSNGERTPHTRPC